MSSTSLRFFGRSEKQDGHPCLWLAETFWLLFWTEFNETNKRKQDLNVLYQVCVFRDKRKTKMEGQTSDWLRHFLLHFSVIAKWNSTKLDRKHDLNIFYQVCVFRMDWKNKMAAPSLWLAETFSTSLKQLNRIQWNLLRSHISVSSTKFVFLGPIRKLKMATLSDPSTKVAHCTRVKDMWPFGPLFCVVFEFVIGKW